MRVTRKVEFCKCNRCGHEWLNRTLHDPRICPYCKSVKWDDITGLCFDTFEDADRFLSKNYGPIKWLNREVFECSKGKFGMVFSDKSFKTENV
jgi:hypothetical protein